MYIQTTNSGVSTNYRNGTCYVTENGVTVPLENWRTND